MTQKLFCLCVAAALLFVFATVNVASAQEVATPAPVGCPCAFTAAPCAPCITPGCPPFAGYRIGPFGAVRPVVYAPPVVRVPVYRPVFVPRYYRAVGYPPMVTCPPYYW